MSEPEVTADPAQTSASIAAVFNEKLNLASYQNAVPVLRELIISNTGNTPLKALTLCIQSEPPFFKPGKWTIDLIEPGQNYSIDHRDLPLDGALFSRLTEAEFASVKLTLTAGNAPDLPLTHLQSPIELLPRNHWTGISIQPEMISAFVQPNDPIIDRILKKAADVLHTQNKNAALNGYEDGPTHAWEIASAIWTAIASLSLDYAFPPASFEQLGQKVRGPSQIIETGLATCLDLSLLFAAAFEQAGLNSLIIILDGHAFAGCWVRKDEFSSTVVDDASLIRNRIRLNELILFETTILTSRPSPAFSRAIELGTGMVADDYPKQFELLVDINRCRMHGLKPLATTAAPGIASLVPMPEPVTIEPVYEEAPNLAHPGDSPLKQANMSPADRIEHWKRKLLDLSLRNSLLNFRSSKKALKIEAPNPALLEDLLANRNEFRLLPRPALLEGSDTRDRQLFEQRENRDARREHALLALNKKELFVLATDEELDNNLTEFYRSARTSLEEGGANTLFLALGFLVWSRDEKDSQKYRAPLILLPVTLQRQSIRSGFTLALQDDEPRFNPTLLQMLRQDFHLNLGIEEGELPKDDSGLDVQRIWNQVSQAVKNTAGWEVTSDVVLSLFSFGKYLMWKDLADRADQLRQSPVVRHLIDSPRENFNSDVPFVEPRDLDETCDPSRTFCPLPADSSQLSAILAAANGKDFVLVGPPGTGKSQTIANLIAQCLAEGKRILFVAEKIAALDVVYRRLREVGLGDFCLQLHSSKARKAEVLAQLNSSWEARGESETSHWHSQAERLKVLRNNLNGYVATLHEKFPNGLTIYKAIGTVVRRQDIPKLALSWPAPNSHSNAAMDELRQLVSRLEVNSRAADIELLNKSSLSEIRQPEWTPFWLSSLTDAATSLRTVAFQVDSNTSAFASLSGFRLPPFRKLQRTAICRLGKALLQTYGKNWSFLLKPQNTGITDRLSAAASILLEHRDLSSRLLEPWPVEMESSLKQGAQWLASWKQYRSELLEPWSAHLMKEGHRGLELLQQLRDTEKSLSVAYSEAIRQCNIGLLQRNWAKAQNTIWPFSIFARKKIRRELEACAIAIGEIDITGDLQKLSQIRRLETELKQVEITSAQVPLWMGSRTNLLNFQSGLKLQRCLAFVRDGQPWSTEGLERIGSGLCGEQFEAQLPLLTTLKDLEIRIESLEALRQRSNGIWIGLNTDANLLSAALSFESERRTLQKSGSLTSNYPLIESGACGPELQRNYQIIQARFATESQLASCMPLAEATSGFWRGLETSPSDIAALDAFAKTLKETVSIICPTSDSHAIMLAAIAKLLGENNSELRPGGPLQNACDDLLLASATLQPEIEKLCEVARVSNAYRANLEDSTTRQIAACTEALIDGQARIRDWCAWHKATLEARRIGLGLLVDAIESRLIPTNQISTTFEVNYSRWWLNATVDGNPQISGFVSAEHERRIEDFVDLDNQFAQLTRQYIRAKLSTEMPAFSSELKSPDWGTLRREINKRTKHMALRKLMSNIPDVVTKLTPCFLMSPLSIAQYLDAKLNTFDIVVFDEASQIPVWDAIGSMARGKSVVVVGDPKQLPPTSFFSRAESNEEPTEVEEDLESILDESMSANIPVRSLAWHYRSRHESLISFSNRHYYKDQLVTFPSPVTNDRAVSYQAVAGIYAKGGARTNQIEAKAVVADLVARLLAEEHTPTGHSVGVVTFNGEQQRLIEDLLDQERRNDPSLERFFSDKDSEHVFIKNLESVQGDERDVMYFSTTYGPDTNGNLSMNFGPMNKRGGERRLNVAITRARHELRVFSSLKPEKMDLSRTSSEGVRDLKHFLEFAQRGITALTEATPGSLGGYESPFEEAVAMALQARGWQVHSQIGASNFRIDLGIVNPDSPGIYLAGIECDGATYHRSATARDRDKLRQQVLQSLGWKMLRVWSTDWWTNPVHTTEALNSKLHTLMKKSQP